MGSRVSKKAFLAGLAKAAAEKPKAEEPKAAEPRATAVLQTAAVPIAAAQATAAEEAVDIRPKTMVIIPATQTSPAQPQSEMDAVSDMVAAMLKKSATDSPSGTAETAAETIKPQETPIPQETSIPQDILLRVAAYIRVSSENESQEDSYEIQEKYFTNLLAENPNWVSAGIYSDYGISATSDKNRVGFQRLLRHCKEGKIDRIIVKSISRFARNTMDFLDAMNKLKEYGVSILFEKEALDSNDAVSEFVLTTLAAIAQEESRSISSNIRWGLQARFPKGDVPNRVMYGYRYAEGDDAYETTESGYTRRKVEIVEEESEVVRRIFEEAAAGAKYTEIARNLNHDHVPAPPLKRTKNCRLKEGVEQGWTGPRIGCVVKNERYCGDVKVQKSYTEDYLSHKSKVNKGEMPQYYVRDHHPAIVSRELFEAAQGFSAGGTRESKTYPLSGILICAHCGRTYHVRNNRHNPIWFCPSTALNNGRCICYNDFIYEEQIVKAMRKGMAARFGQDYVTDIRARLEHLQDADFNESDRAMLKRRGQILFAERSNVERRKKLARTKLQTQKVRADVFGEGLDELETLEKEIEACEQKLADITGKEEALKAENDSRESYWRMLEDNYKWRAEAIQWMRTLPDGKEGTEAFIEGLETNHVKAFVLSITVHDEKHFTIRWFDDMSSDVELYDAVEDHRIGHDYF